MVKHLVDLKQKPKYTYVLLYIIPKYLKEMLWNVNTQKVLRKIITFVVEVLVIVVVKHLVKLKQKSRQRNVMKHEITQRVNCKLHSFIYAYRRMFCFKLNRLFIKNIFLFLFIFHLIQLARKLYYYVFLTWVKDYMTKRKWSILVLFWHLSIK